MRKGFIIDLQSGLNYNGNYTFQADVGGNVLFPNSGSNHVAGADFPYSRKTRIGDMWIVSGSSLTGNLTLSGSAETINISVGDYIIVKATGSNGYVCRFSSSHWEIHKANPTTGWGLTYDSYNTWHIEPITNYGLAIASTGVGVSGSNLTAKTAMQSSDYMMILTGSDQRPLKITYQNFLNDVNANVNDYWTDRLTIIDYKFTSDNASTYASQGYLDVYAQYNTTVDLSSKTEIFAHISNLFLKVSGSYSTQAATSYEIQASRFNSNIEYLQFRIQNLKFKLEEDDLLQVWCFTSGSATFVAASTTTPPGG